MSGYTLNITGEGIAEITFDLPGKVNVMNDDFFVAMGSLLPEVERQKDSLKGVIITSAKSTFFAGGDLALMRDSKPGQEEFIFRHFEKLKGFLRFFERLGVPVVAAINGTALGGGYELCLACHRRIAMKSEKALIGLPEVAFGILPAAGGVIRLTAVLGLQRALEFLLTGKKVSVAEALESGLVDEVVETREEMMAAARNWILRNPAAQQSWDQKTDFGAHRLTPKQRVDIFMAPAWMRAKGLSDDKACVRIADIAAESMYLDFDTSSRIETRGFVELLLRDEAHEKISAFFKKVA